MKREARQPSFAFRKHKLQREEERGQMIIGDAKNRAACTTVDAAPSGSEQKTHVRPVTHQVFIMKTKR